MNTQRVGCGESCTSGSEGGPGKPTNRKVGGAPRSDPYTKLAGPERGVFFQLYVLLDIYSRYVPGWMLAHAENAKLTQALLADTVAKQNIGRHQLTIHADRGSPMTAELVAFLLADLGVTRATAGRT
jgi:transposase InsO family protein